MRQWREAEHMVLQHGPPVSGGDEVAAVLRGLPRRHPVPARPDAAAGQPGLREGRDRAAGRASRRTSRTGHRGCARSTGRWSTTCRPSSTTTWAGSTAIRWCWPRRRGPSYAARLVGLMGGRDAVLRRGRTRPSTSDDPQFAAELATYLDPGGRRRPSTPAWSRPGPSAGLGYAQINPTWRGFYLTARRLPGRLAGRAARHAAPVGRGESATRPTCWRQLPAGGDRRRSCPVRLVAEAVFDLHLSVGLASRLHRRRPSRHSPSRSAEAWPRCASASTRRAAVVLRGARRVLGPVLLAGGDPAARLVADGSGGRRILGARPSDFLAVLRRSARPATRPSSSAEM